MKDFRAGKELGVQLSADYGGWRQPRARDRTINHRCGEAGEPRSCGERHAACLQAFPGSRGRAASGGERPGAPGDAHSGAGCILPSPVPAWGLRAAGLPWAPGGPPRHGGCAPRLSGGRGRSHGLLSSHAALGPGLTPTHTAPGAQPRRPSPSFPAVQAPTLHTGPRLGAHKAAGLAR